MTDLGDLDPRQFLAVPCCPFVATLRLEFKDADLLAAQVLNDLRFDAELRECGRIKDRIVGAHHQWLEADRRPFVLGQAFDEKGLPLLDAVLLASGLNDRVHQFTQL